MDKNQKLKNSRVIKQIRRLFRIPLHRWGTVFYCTVVMAAIALAINAFPFYKVYKQLKKLYPKRKVEYNAKSIEDILWAVPRIGRTLFGDQGCLYQALTGELLLNRNGMTTSMRIGVRKSPDGTILAHAWVENQGDILIGGDQEFIVKSFKQFPDFSNMFNN